MLPVIPNTLKLHRRGSCVPAVIACLAQLQNGRDHIVEGLVRFGTRGREHEHTWMLIEGKVFDPTLVQFRRLKAFSNDVQRETRLALPVDEFRHVWAARRSQWWIERCINFGVPASLCT